MIEPIDEEMNLDEDSIELGIREYSITIPITLDERYNLIIYKEYGIGLSSDWVMAHLKEYHGVRTIMEEVLILLGVGDYIMILVEIENWIQNIWIGIAIQNIPVIKGFGYNEYQYSAGRNRIMKNHFSKEYKGLRRVENTKEYKVQLVFKGGL
jgi:hypothetical protein